MLEKSVHFRKESFYSVVQRKTSLGFRIEYNEVKKIHQNIYVPVYVVVTARGLYKNENALTDHL